MTLLAESALYAWTRRATGLSQAKLPRKPRQQSCHASRKVAAPSGHSAHRTLPETGFRFLPTSAKKHESPFYGRQDMETKRNGFRLGQTLITPGARDALYPEDVMKALQRHAAKDWGDCRPDDWQANDQALLDGSRLFSVYHDRAGVRFWIITEADRSATTILLPSEY